MEQKIISTNIPHIGDISVNVLQTTDSWWCTQIEWFITRSPERFAIIAINNPALKSPALFQKELQRFVTFIQSGGEPQTCNKILSHFNNWINKQNGTFSSVQRSTQSNGTKIAGTEIIESNKQYGGRLGRRT